MEVLYKVIKVIILIILRKMYFYFQFVVKIYYLFKYSLKSKCWRKKCKIVVVYENFIGKNVCIYL